MVSFDLVRIVRVVEWRDAHRRELLENWERLRSGQPPLQILPLD